MPLELILIAAVILGFIDIILIITQTTEGGYAKYCVTFVLLEIILISWLIAYAYSPLKIKNTSIVQIQTIKYIDDSSSQIFIVDGRHYNVIEKFGRVLDEKSWEVEVIDYEKYYCGLFSSNLDDRKFNLKRK